MAAVQLMTGVYGVVTAHHTDNQACQNSRTAHGGTGWREPRPHEMRVALPRHARTAQHAGGCCRGVEVHERRLHVILFVSVIFILFTSPEATAATLMVTGLRELSRVCTTGVFRLAAVIVVMPPTMPRMGPRLMPPSTRPFWEMTWLSRLICVQGGTADATSAG